MGDETDVPYYGYDIELTDEQRAAFLKRVAIRENELAPFLDQSEYGHLKPLPPHDDTSPESHSNQAS